MSYALETKKRKFERILESLADHSTSQSHITLSTRIAGTVPSSNPSSSTESSKRRRITPIGSVQRLAQTSTASLTTHYLPSSRLAFLERLESFRQVTKWHIPSTSVINAVEWAKRGWVCQDTDTVSCPSCKERLHVDIELDPSTAPELEDDQEVEGDDPLEMANAVLAGLTKRYQEMVVTGHTEVCPWRRRGCDHSIHRIEGLLNMSTALEGLEHRYQSIVEPTTDVPKVVQLPSSESCSIHEQELERIKFSDGVNPPDLNTIRLALCGWQRKEKDIIECRHCFRSLGLWLYRGPQPTVEHLDAIDSHLEYCPWRSELAQDTEISLLNDKGEPNIRKRSGWILTYLAVVKKNNKGRNLASHSQSQHLNEMNDENTLPQLSPDQREKKMKDLIKRIRDLKKPFNVKSLLKRKDKT